MQRNASERRITFEVPKHDPLTCWVTVTASPPSEFTGTKIWAAVGFAAGVVGVDDDVDAGTDAAVGVEVGAVGP
jgi:hypothetical protein